MIFISAQPDQYYFLWQLELQIFNFRKLKINLDNVHILVAYDEDISLSVDFKIFKKKYKELKIFTYADTRKRKKYLSSIRPHILAKHFEQHPELSKEIFFYHDSDIVFSHLPDFELLEKGGTWYASDTRDYISSNYILATAGEALFLNMCEIVGINPERVKDNDRNAGGAQYIIKNVDAAFWHKLEADCEDIYSLLYDAENELNKVGFDEKPFIQKWCTDMWAIWWNALIFNNRFEIHKELNFCWADSPITEWGSTNILHYTGGINKSDKHLFRKGDYFIRPPYYEKHDKIEKDTCSFALIEIIKEFNQYQLAHRTNLKDVSFLIPIKIDSPDRLRNLYASTSFLNKSFNTNIIVMEVDQTQRIDPKDLPEGITYVFKPTESSRLFRTRINNEMIKMCSSKFIALYDADVIIPKRQINRAVQLLRKGDIKIISPYEGVFLNVDELLREIFIKLQDDEFLLANQYKTGMPTRRSFGGCILLNRACYIDSGMENENLTSWGPDDIERVKRMQILGHKTVRLKGSLFHFDHERKVDSGYVNGKEHEELMLTYLDMSGMDKNQLIDHINTWEWTKI